MREEVHDILKALQNDVTGTSRAAKRLTDALGVLASDDASLVEVASGLQTLEKHQDDEDARWSTVLTDARRRVERGRIKATMKLCAALEAAAVDGEFELEKLSDRPLVLGLGMLAVECDVTTNSARLLFGREVARDDVAAAAEDIVDARAAVLANHEQWAEEAPDTTFERLRRAYEVVLLREERPSGERVELVDVAVPLAFFAAEPKAWRRRGPAGISPYPSHRLAFDLYRLRRSGILEHDGRRLELGAATGGSTADKRNVLFVPTSSADGQYYASIRFTE